MPAKQRRRFGSIRKRASGRYQVRYQGPDGQMRSAPQTFERKGDAIDGQEAVKALGEITDFQDGIHLKPGVP